MKRAQIKLFESLAVLVIFFFFIVFGASFYFKLQESSLRKQLDENSQLHTQQIAQKSSTMPELECSSLGVAQENCIDVLKVQAFANLLANDDTARLDYFKLFDYSTLVVHEVYPSADSWTVYDRQQENKTTSSNVIQIPVLIRHPAQGANAFGYLEVKVYG
jgi:hypothetical protein